MGQAVHRVTYATGSRADYGIVRRYLRLLDDDPSIDLSVLATGSMLSEEYGRPVDLVRADGFRVGAEVPIPLDSATAVGAIRAMAVALEGFGELFAREAPDLLVVLGDRYEMLSVATAAAMQRVPILHIHGGEATFANYDEFIRHSITKMAHFHITSTEEYRRRVIQLGEDPSRVWNLGSLGVENCLLGEDDSVPDDVLALPSRGYGVVLFHPETLTGASPAQQVREVLDATLDNTRLRWVFIGSNADTGSDGLKAEVHRHVALHEGCAYFENLSPGAYHHLLRNAACLVGNSSSGIIEAPSLGVRTVNVGRRQEGRVRGQSVIDVPCERAAIGKAIEAALGLLGRPLGDNPYYQPNAAAAYHVMTKYVLHLLDTEGAPPKAFYDLAVKEDEEA